MLYFVLMVSFLSGVFSFVNYFAGDLSYSTPEFLSLFSSFLGVFGAVAVLFNKKIGRWGMAVFWLVQMVYILGFDYSYIFFSSHPFFFSISPNLTSGETSTTVVVNLLAVVFFYLSLKLKISEK
ncbi:hypothetical protein [Motilimonas sp. E26]|uniref:hypothetical protein n=1 Tax=Motilimonas sp. E26 TaxID=2865674 RepID=UPI001E632521|nr:hypothetical protein [Motilimonas sp. E26]MCE0556153.1 hypothetical protein [Motilimonas sp. E26]